MTHKQKICLNCQHLHSHIKYGINFGPTECRGDPKKRSRRRPVSIAKKEIRCGSNSVWFLKKVGL